MSHNITVEGGTSVRLPTAGKYCDRDIVITAEGGTEDLDAVLTEQEALIAELQDILMKKAAGDNDEADYTFLEYIESHGVEYIDTKLTPYHNTGFDIDFISYNDISHTAGEYGAVIGSRVSSASNEFQLTTYAYPAGSSQGTLRYGKKSYDPKLKKGVRTYCTMRNRVFNNDQGGGFTVRSEIFSSPYGIIIFALNNGGTVAQHGKVRLYALKLYSDTLMVRDFRPAKRKTDGEIGLYDKVTRTFFTNAGTGAFTGVSV